MAGGKLAARVRAAARRAGSARYAFLLAALLLGPAAAALAGFPMAGGGDALARNAVTGAGGLASGGGLSLNGALAEAVVGTFSGGGLGLGSGYMPLAAQPGSVISLSAVTKSTGTLELAWTAPGLDGFLGAVTGGLYRIDVSSDASHVFDPTVYAAEFSTSVTPGDPQAYVLTGLQPNTTYYARVYLGDARRVIAERSAGSADSTLANLPAAPALSGVFSSSVTFSWALPAGGAEGYSLDGSSTAFGALFPGGVLRSSSTPEGTVLTLTVAGLYPGTTYYFRLASLNWQADVNFGAVIAACTLPGTGPLPIENLASVRDAAGRRLLFSWTNPDYPDRAGVLVQMSTAPMSYPLAPGAAYADGALLPDGSRVLASAAASSQLHGGLALNATYYYRFSSQDAAHSYSVFVATECILDLPPMSPAGLQASLSPDRSAITLSWAGVTSNLDGSAFRNAAEPMELARYDVYRATGVIRPGWTLVASVPVSSQSVTVPVPDQSAVYYYRVASADTAGAPGVSMVVDTQKNLYALAPDQVSRLKIPAALSGVVAAAGNPSGHPLFFAARERTTDEGGKVIKSVEFAPVRAPDGAEVTGFRVDSPDMDIVLRYDILDGQVVPSSVKAAASGAAPAAAAQGPAAYVPASDAASSLGVYWFNGKDYVKVFGSVDPAGQTVTVRSALPGSYQIRSLARTGGVSFDVKQMSNKVITPNGDGLNDYVTFTLDNPRDSAFSGKIYDLTGAFVADMRPGRQVADSLEWDGKAGGATVPRGVYVYQIKAEGKTFNGTIVVIR